MIKNTRRELRDIESLVHRKTYDLWKKFWFGYDDFKLLCDYLGVEGLLDYCAGGVYWWVSQWGRKGISLGEGILL